MRMHVSFVALLFVLQGCQGCLIDNTNLNNVPDAGHDVPDAGPPPPVFPLKAGDEVQFQIGGRIPDDVSRCPNHATPGDCERDMKATFVMNAPRFENGRWTLSADYFYEGTKDLVQASVIAQLVLSRGVPFDGVSVASPENGTADFLTDQAPTRDASFNQNTFPFFQYESGDAQIFQTAGAAFCDYFNAQDDQANCDVRPGDHRIEAYFVDPLAEGKLHELRVEYHPMGFICDWKETLADLGPDPARNQNSFNGNEGDPTAFFYTPISLERGGNEYRCFCSSGVCKDITDSTKCLDPADPDVVVACP